MVIIRSRLDLKQFISFHEVTVGCVCEILNGQSRCPIIHHEGETQMNGDCMNCTRAGALDSTLRSAADRGHDSLREWTFNRFLKGSLNKLVPCTETYSRQQ